MSQMRIKHTEHPVEQLNRIADIVMDEAEARITIGEGSKVFQYLPKPTIEALVDVQILLHIVDHDDVATLIFALLRRMVPAGTEISIWRNDEEGSARYTFFTID